MSSEDTRSLAYFVARFLESHGALVERQNGGMDALLPEKLARRLQTPEELRLTFGPLASAAQGDVALNYGTPLLERMVEDACAQVPIVDCRLSFDYLKTQGFASLIDQQFVFHGAVARVVNTAEVLTQYLALSCRYLAQSDEQKEGMLSLVYHVETGAEVSGMEAQLMSVARSFADPGPAEAWDESLVRRIMDWAEKGLSRRVAAEIGPFAESMNRRYRRDVSHLEAYYQSLADEMTASLQRSGLSAAGIADRKEKIALIPEELERKKNDLFKKYSIRVKAALCGAMRIQTPAVKIYLRLAVGRRNQDKALIYNPVTKALDPAVCQGCGASTNRIYFCTGFHRLCPECRRSCPACA
jgi:uncharacterized small protein (DUF1192 family)